MLFSTKLRPLFGSKHLHLKSGVVFISIVVIFVVVVVVEVVVVVKINVDVEEVVWTGVVVDFVV